MQNAEWIEMLRVIPPEKVNQLCLVLSNGSEISIDTIFRFEPNYLVLRGRLGGTTDEGRAFFVPYDQMVCFRIERVVNLVDLQAIYDGHPARPSVQPVETSAAPAVASHDPSPAGASPVTEATATRNALLDRIRATRAIQANPGREGSK